MVPCTIRTVRRIEKAKQENYKQFYEITINFVIKTEEKTARQS
jgi:hypothetical protein